MASEDTRGVTPGPPSAAGSAELRTGILLAEAKFNPAYVGAMNDCLFIIDQPPRPAPKDYDTGTMWPVNVIAKMADGSRVSEKWANLFATSPDLYEALRRLEGACDAAAGARGNEIYLAMIDAGLQPQMEAVDEARRLARAALSKAAGGEPLSERDGGK